MPEIRHIYPWNRVIPPFRNRTLEYISTFLLPPVDGRQVHGSVTPLPSRIKFTSTHSYTWAERGTVRVKRFAEKHNTMSPARARIRTVGSSVKRINHETTAPPTMTRGRFLKEGINYTMYNSYSRDESAILGITIPVIKMGSRKHYLSFE